jgi:hypothetical protein
MKMEANFHRGFSPTLIWPCYGEKNLPRKNVVTARAKAI